MRIFFGQIYIQEGANFPFSCRFQQYLSGEVTCLVTASAKFCTKYGDDWKLVFNISAKHSLNKNEIRGPTVFKITHDVEYTIFLPYEVIMAETHPPTAALNWIFAGIYETLHRLEIDASQVHKQQERLVKYILSDPEMFQDLKHIKVFGTDAVAERTDSEHLDPAIWRATE